MKPKPSLLPCLFLWMANASIISASTSTSTSTSTTSTTSTAAAEAVAAARRRKLTFLSGAADTTQSFHIASSKTTSTAIEVTRHHYVCYHRGTPKSYSPPKSTSSSSTSTLSASSSLSSNNNEEVDWFQDPLNTNEGREKCCHELYMSNLLPNKDKTKNTNDPLSIPRHFKQYCLEHIAMIPDWSDKLSRRRERGVRPVFYLMRDVYHYNESDILLDDDTNTVAAGQWQQKKNQGYKQIRQLKVMDEQNERERLWDMPRGGVEAFSPFHLVGFMDSLGGSSSSSSNGVGHAAPSTTNNISDDNNEGALTGSVVGTLSKEGGMHRSFWHKVHLSLNDDPTKSLVEGGNGYYNDEASVNINATIFLPLMQDVFIDADDALIISYNGGDEGVACTVSIAPETITNEVPKSSQCNIRFLSSETIDIEQPSFASRQYVVAFQVHATLNNVPTSLVSKLEVVIDYGTTLHIRYPAPIVNASSTTAVSPAGVGMDGLVPISIQQPSLYSAGISIIAQQQDGSNSERQYILQTIAGTLLSSSNDDVTTNTLLSEKTKNDPLDPMVINIAAGTDDDYWLVTFVTLSAALIGGCLLVISLDSVSTWG